MLSGIFSDVFKKFYEREEIIRTMVISIISREHCLLLGPPGTAKSALVEAIASAAGLGYFRTLLTRFTTPDEVLGVVDINLIEKGEYRRITKNMLPDNEIAFIDEIFKASPAILNALLSIMQERKYRNGTQMENAKTVTIFGASNELPDGEEEDILQAFYDRFLFRLEVEPIKSKDNFILMLQEDEESLNNNGVQKVNWGKIWQEADNVKIDSSIYDAIYEIKKQITDFYISDRRWKKTIKAVKASAVYEGRNNAEVDDLMILKHIIYEPRYKESKKTIEDIISRIIDPYNEEIKEIIKTLKKIQNDVEKDSGENPNYATELVLKIKDIKNEIKQIEESNRIRNKKLIKDAADLSNNLLKGIMEKYFGIKELV
ncbi:MAG: AAA family ATPase [Thermovenabulum sp.]|uniref:AAA family ATPase n=1 Tax=Thermovenabulum sp. TaxID=3100335 RepID=UPI003C79FF9B